MGSIQPARTLPPHIIPELFQLTTALALAGIHDTCQNHPDQKYTIDDFKKLFLQVIDTIIAEGQEVDKEVFTCFRTFIKTKTNQKEFNTCFQLFSQGIADVRNGVRKKVSTIQDASASEGGAFFEEYDVSEEDIGHADEMSEKDRMVGLALSAIVTSITEYVLEHMSAQDALREMDFDRFLCAFISATHAITQNGDVLVKKVWLQLQGESGTYRDNIGIQTAYNIFQSVLKENVEGQPDIQEKREDSPYTHALFMMLMQVEKMSQVSIQQKGMVATQNIPFQEFQRIFFGFFQNAGELKENGDTYTKVFEVFQNYEQTEKDFILKYCWDTFRAYAQNPIRTMSEIHHLQETFMKMMFSHQSHMQH